MSQYDYVVCPSGVRLSVTFRYRDHIGWNMLKIISRLNSIRYVLRFKIDPDMGDFGPTGTPPKLGWSWGGVMSTKNLQYFRNCAR